MAEERSCAVCGCTEAKACHDELRGACWWVGERLCSHCAVPDARRSLAIVAAEHLSAVVDELIRFSREGDQETFTPFALEPVENTCRALQRLIVIEAYSNEEAEYRPQAGANQLAGALANYLDQAG